MKKLLVATLALCLSSISFASSIGAPVAQIGPLLIFADPMRPVDFSGDTHATGHFHEGGISATRLGASNASEAWFSIPNYTDTYKGATVWYITDFTLDTAKNKMYWVDYYGVNVGTIGGCKGASKCGKLLYSSSDLQTSDGYEYTTGIAIDPDSQTLYVGVYSNSLGEYQIKKMSTTHNNSTISVVESAAHIPNGNGIGSISIYDGKLYWTQGTNDPTTTGVAWGNLEGPGSGMIATGTLNPDLTVGIWGLTIDRDSRKIYWANWTSRYRAPNGSIGVYDLVEQNYWLALQPETCGSASAGDEFLSGPNGIAYDYHDDSITWGNWNWSSQGDPAKAIMNTNGYGTRCRFIEVNQGMKYDGISPVSYGQQSAVAYLYKPEFSSTPQITLRTRVHASLFCNAAFDADRGEAHLYLAPSSVTYSWTLNGKKITGGKSSLRATKAGNYKCTVTGTNYSGSTIGTSGTLKVTAAQAK